MGDRSSEKGEIVRRSVTMLAPGQPCQLSREIAVELMEELLELRERERRVRRLVEQLAEAVGTGGQSSTERPGVGDRGQVRE